MNSLIIDYTYFRIAAYKSWREGDKFFNQFNLFGYIQDGKYAEVIRLGISILKDLLDFDQKAYINIHKGTPYYWMGMASYLLNDFTTATYFFDAAVSEDIRNKEKNDLLKSPSILFAFLDDTKLEQAGRFLVKNTIDSINELINIFNDPTLGNCIDRRHSLQKFGDMVYSQKLE